MMPTNRAFDQKNRCCQICGRRLFVCWMTRIQVRVWTGPTLLLWADDERVRRDPLIVCKQRSTHPHLH
jgi:hypothetical protein